MQVAHRIQHHSGTSGAAQQQHRSASSIPHLGHTIFSSSCSSRRAAPLRVRSANSGNGSGVGAAPISIIASDVDGTLLNSQQQLTAGVEAAVRKAAEAGVPLIVATGKARGPWLPDVMPRLGLQLPGVFLQGLLITDMHGNVLHSRCLPDDVVQSCIELAAKHYITLTAYCNDRIFCKDIDEHTNRLLWYKEPTPEPVGDLEQHLIGKVEVQKLILMAPQSVIDLIRPTIEAALSGRATCTTALSGMLEVLPVGASKGAGVQWLLNHLGISPSGLLALGDGENDIEMLQLAAVGVAMGNAGPKVKAVADAVTASNDDDGVAKAIHEYVLKPRQLSEGRAVVQVQSGAAQQH